MEKKQTEKKNTFARNITIGVAVGALATLCKRENRERLTANARKVKEKMCDLRNQAAPIKERVKETVQDIRAKGSQLTDKEVVNEKIESIKKITPLVIETLQESREIFNRKKQELKEQEEAKRKEEELAFAQAEASATTVEEVSLETEEIPEEETEKKEEAGADKK
ncbi:hypothetical protein [Ectobacillus polymachus]|uniref:hypothetical protein n=1 Tax=Ectobacillus polymachus TaxID=1508806 RepID=UPI003A84EF1A